MKQATLHCRVASLKATAELRIPTLKFLKIIVFWFRGKFGGFRKWAEYSSQGLWLVVMYQKLWKNFSIPAISTTLLITAIPPPAYTVWLTCPLPSVDNTIAVSLLLIICLSNCNVLLTNPDSQVLSS